MKRDRGRFLVPPDPAQLNPSHGTPRASPRGVFDAVGGLPRASAPTTTDETQALRGQLRRLSGSLRASGAYDTVEFSFVYDYNANVSCFDGAQLFREKFAARQGDVAFVLPDTAQ